MHGTTRAILLVADISGYTKFMKHHSIAISHAKQIIVRLLKSLIATSRLPLKLAELEGDAVFFYAAGVQGRREEIAPNIRSQVARLFATFEREIKQIDSLSTCPCEACDNITDLKLKQVLHYGDVAIEKIESFEKLFGLDVILVHRMLKNTVPSREYVMMTAPMYEYMGEFYGLEPERRQEEFEGVGQVETLVFYPAALPDSTRALEPPKPPSLLQRLAWRYRISRDFVLERLGLRKFKGAFRNVPL
jgi:hypothetical protein